MQIPKPLLIGFDIETSEQAQDDRVSPITVASTVTSDGEKRAWFSIAGDPSFVGIVGKQRDETWAPPTGKGNPDQLMSKGVALAMLQYMDDKRKNGYAVCAWNGAGFDLKMLGHIAEDLELAGRIAMDLYDPMFQILTVKGYPVGLSAVQKGLGISQEKSMAGKDAPDAWKNGEFQKVIGYVVGDSEITVQAVLAIAKAGGVNWTAKSGKPNSLRFDRFKTIAECLLEKDPDNSWMDKPIDRKQIVAWIPAKLMGASAPSVAPVAKPAAKTSSKPSEAPSCKDNANDDAGTKPVLLVISGPSGAGKSLLCEELMRTMPSLKRSITVTTRKPRDGEKDGESYNFVSVEKFDKMVSEGAFLELAEVHGNKYGSSKTDISKKLADKQNVAMIVDVQGGASIRTFFNGLPESTKARFRFADVFVTAPSMDELKRRLVARGKDDAETIENRMKNAVSEISQAKFYKYLIVNEDMHRSWDRLRSIVLAEKCLR